MPKHTVMYVNYFFNKTRKRKKKKKKTKGGEKKVPEVTLGCAMHPTFMPRVRCKERKTKGQRDRQSRCIPRHWAPSAHGINQKHHLYLYLKGSRSTVTSSRQQIHPHLTQAASDSKQEKRKGHMSFQGWERGLCLCKMSRAPGEDSCS